MKCTKQTKEPVKGFFKCSQCGNSWPVSYGETPVCFAEPKKEPLVVRVIKKSKSSISFEPIDPMRILKDNKLDGIIRV